MTYEIAFKRIKEKFAAINSDKLADMAVQVTLTDEDCGGTFYFKAEKRELSVEPYDYRDNDAVIDIDRKALMDILSGKATLDKAIEKGLATAKGDFAKLDTLKDAIPAYVPAKKETTKTADIADEPIKKENVPSVDKEEPVQKESAKTTTVKKTVTKTTARKNTSTHSRRKKK